MLTGERGRAGRACAWEGAQGPAQMREPRSAAGCLQGPPGTPELGEAGAPAVPGGGSWHLLRNITKKAPGVLLGKEGVGIWL